MTSELLLALLRWCYRSQLLMIEANPVYPPCRSAEWPDVTQQSVSGAAGCGAGPATLRPVPGAPAPVCRGRGLRPERPGQEDQGGKVTEEGGEDLHWEISLSFGLNLLKMKQKFD